MLSSDLVQQWSKGLVFVVSAPAGAGKTTLVRFVTSIFPTVVHLPSLTTRPRRVHEINGVDYYFVTKERFEQYRKSGKLLEEIELHGYQYGTLVDTIEKERSSGHHVILVIDTRGAFAIRQILNPILIFVKPPSIEALRKRLIERGTEDPTDIEQRVKWAEGELSEEKSFDYTIVNDHLGLACEILASIVIAETHKIQK